MRIRMVALLAVAVAACDGASVLTPTTSSTPTAVATETPAAATPQPTSTPPPPSATLAPGATPGPTALDLLPYLTSEITVVNLEDQALGITVTLIDADSAQEFEVGTFDLQPFQVTIQAVVPARLRITFSFAGAAAPSGTCTIDVADGEQLQFAATKGGVAITAAGQEPAAPADMVVSTAARCHAGGAT